MDLSGEEWKRGRLSGDERSGVTRKNCEWWGVEGRKAECKLVEMSRKEES